MPVWGSAHNLRQHFIFTFVIALVLLHLQSAQRYSIPKISTLSCTSRRPFIFCNYSQIAQPDASDNPRRLFQIIRVHHVCGCNTTPVMTTQQQLGAKPDLYFNLVEMIAKIVKDWEKLTLSTSAVQRRVRMYIAYSTRLSGISSSASYL